MDVELSYREKGTGMPLILLHGNGEDSSYFASQMEYFSRFYRVIAVDTRGHGRTPRGTAPFTIRQFARDLKERMETLGIQRAHILGFSDGGNIALVFALCYPQMVDHLILNGANLNIRGMKLSVQIPIMAAYRKELLVARVCRRLNPWRGAKAWRRVEVLGLMINDPNIPVQALHRLSMPVLVIAGTKDMIRRSHTRQIGREIPGAQTVLVQGNHFVARNNPEAFNRQVKKFLEG